MARVFVGVVVFYMLLLLIFTIVNISLVFLKSRSISLAVKSIVIFGLFPILVFTQDGRRKLQQITTSN